MSINILDIVVKNEGINALVEERRVINDELFSKDLSIAKMKEECNHELVLKCGDKNSSMGIFHICPICGRKLYEKKGQNVLSSSIILDFTQNKYSKVMRNYEYVIPSTIMKAIRTVLTSKPSMTLEEFVSMIPADWYTNEEIFKDDNNPGLFLPFTKYNFEKEEPQKVKVKRIPNYFVGHRK